jgi:hypothetical protein
VKRLEGAVPTPSSLQPSTTTVVAASNRRLAVVIQTFLRILGLALTA